MIHLTGAQIQQYWEMAHDIAEGALTGLFHETRRMTRDMIHRSRRREQVCMGTLGWQVQRHELSLVLLTGLSGIFLAIGLLIALLSIASLPFWSIVTWPILAPILVWVSMTGSTWILVTCTMLLGAQKAIVDIASLVYR